MKKNLLWPTEIYSFKNNTVNNTEILNLILQKEKTEKSRSISNIGGWQSSEDLLFESSFHEVKTFLFQCTDMLKRNFMKMMQNFHYFKVGQMLIEMVIIIWATFMVTHTGLVFIM